MYLDLTLKKILPLFIMVTFLTSAVYATHAAKRSFFGSTPYFYTISVGTQYALASVFAEFNRLARNAYASAASPFVHDGTGTRAATAIPVLTYHRVLKTNDPNNTTLAAFRDHMTTLKNAGWHAVTLDDFEAFIRGERMLPERSFLLTFDDGAKQSFYPVDPILRELDFHGVLFIIVHSSKTPESTYYLAPEEIRRLLETGRWSIGSHSYDGNRPYQVDAEGNTGIFFADRLWRAEDGREETPREFTARVADDLRRARAELEATYQRAINTFAFPLGNETGIEGANNFPEGASITEAEAEKIYDIGFVQTNGQRYTFNFPRTATPAFAPAFERTRNALATDFLAWRIHVDHDWNGKRLLSILENGLAKPLPYEDDFAENRGWMPAWGSLEMGRNNFRLAADPAITSASTFLDGSALWNDYSFDAAANWQRGYALVLADVLDSRTYHACAFSPGTVRLQETIHGATRTLAETADARIAYGENVSMGIRVHGSVIECTWNFESLVEDYTRDFSGGIGLQTWDPDAGQAALQVISVIVRPFEESASSTPRE